MESSPMDEALGAFGTPRWSPDGRDPAEASPLVCGLEKFRRVRHVRALCGEQQGSAHLPRDSACTQWVLFPRNERQQKLGFGNAVK